MGDPVRSARRAPAAFRRANRSTIEIGSDLAEKPGHSKERIANHRVESEIGFLDLASGIRASARPGHESRKNVTGGVLVMHGVTF
ncbi:MAG: hypothetical protein M9895_08795 [Aquamicrobium sp.]|uniref:hypothetical protein n=1 Tax=Aquamicrobium sp. TaxID=1872579 RepID=UPI00349E6707|nr:hypothetical protein [Aquamicrobium sp.]